MTRLILRSNPIKEIILDPKINKASIRAFDVDETVPLIAFAEANKVWLLKVNGSSEPIGESAGPQGDV
ncbi:hypothetical protein PIIN_05991 [Serendipita indica DSM 11827]|uniref:Uncharacterized protein n=1 Tax=Serendipita indica (strain DSM 11827) TaxID=1109443 RepID=G4TL63_SERID|nr:hypothetical protein PIIN_05991 [Serendipita indica DSM 11827]